MKLQSKDYVKILLALVVVMSLVMYIATPATTSPQEESLYYVTGCEIL